MSAHRGKFVAYFRVSTDKQGRSGLGFEAQRHAVDQFLNGGSWSLIGEFIEVESGKRNKRPELEKALAVCKRQKAKLVIAKLDRLSRVISLSLQHSWTQAWSLSRSTIRTPTSSPFTFWQRWHSMNGK